MAFPHLRSLAGYLRPYRWSLIGGSIALLLATPCQLFHPLVWMFVVDEVLVAGKHHLLLPALGAMLVVHLIGTALGSWRSWILERAAERVVYDLRTDCFEHLQRQPLAWFHARRAGDIQARVMGDIDAVRGIVVDGLDAAIANALSFVFVAAILVWLQPVVGALTLVPLAGVFVVVLVFNRRVKALYAATRARLGDVTASLHERIAGAAVIKAFAREAAEGERFRATCGDHLAVALRGATVRAAYFPGVRTVGFLSNIVMIGLGAVFVLRGSFTIGGLVAYRGYWWQLFSPVMTLAQINELLARGEAAAARIDELLATRPAVADAAAAIELDAVRGEVAFEDVHFTYAAGSRAAAGLELHVPAGSSLGVVGPSGAGKSTLLALLLRLHDPERGRITIDGHDLRAVSQASLRRQFGLVAQDAFLFHGSVRANIAYGREDADQAAVEEAARLAGALDFIRELPRGFDSVVGERGITLSGGQRQRICIARAFLADPRILLLDEATAAVEPEQELAIQQALERLMAGRTTILVSHRLSLVRGCDRIVTIDGGRIVEQGSHRELLAADGWYARMHRLQTGDAA